MITAKHIQELKKADEQRYDDRYMPLSHLVNLLQSRDGKMPSAEKVQRFLVESGLTVYPLTPQSFVLNRKQVYKFIESKAIKTSSNFDNE